MTKAEYNNETGLSVLEIALLLERKLTPKALTAAVLELCLKTQFSIRNTETGNVAEFQLFRTAVRRKPEELQSEEKLILGILFDNFSRDMIQLSEIDDKVLQNLTVLHKSDIEQIVYARLCAKGLLAPSKPATIFHVQTLRNLFFSMLAVCCFSMAVFLPIFVWYELIDIHFLEGAALLVPFLSSVGVAILLLMLMLKSLESTKRWGPFAYVYTAEGKKVCATLGGYREYIRVAEQDRINFHESPETRERMLTQHLPYAILFGFERNWLKQL